MLTLKEYYPTNMQHFLSKRFEVLGDVRTCQNQSIKDATNLNHFQDNTLQSSLPRRKKKVALSKYRTSATIVRFRIISRTPQKTS